MTSSIGLRCAQLATTALSYSSAFLIAKIFLLACLQLTRRLRTDGFPALGLHGDKSQQERDWVLSEFKNGECGREVLHCWTLCALYL